MDHPGCTDCRLAARNYRVKWEEEIGSGTGCGHLDCFWYRGDYGYETMWWTPWC